jgi:hypothetical protein
VCLREDCTRFSQKVQFVSNAQRFESQLAKQKFLAKLEACQPRTLLKGIFNTRACTFLLMTAMMMHTYTALQPVLDRLSRRFRFDVMPNENGTTLEADDLTLHILSDGRDYMVIFEPFDSCETPIHVAARESEIEAVLRELLAA